MIKINMLKQIFKNLKGTKKTAVVVLVFCAGGGGGCLGVTRERWIKKQS